MAQTHSTMAESMTMHNKKLLIIHHGALGDFITTFPALHILRYQYRSIDAVCQKKLGILASYLGIVENHFPLESALLSSLFSNQPHSQLIRIIRAYDTILLFSFSEHLKDAIQGLTSKIVYHIAPKPMHEEKVHVAAHLLSGLKAAGLISDTMNPDDFLQRFTGHQRRNPEYHASQIILHPGSGSPQKNWRLSYYIQLADLLCAQGKRATFFCGPAERKMVSGIEASGHPVYMGDDLVLLCKLLDKAGGFIGNDSGVSHLAAYVGVPTVAIFGPTDPDRWRPIGPSVVIVQNERQCRPCFEIDRNRCSSLECLSDIDPPKVMEAFSKALKKKDVL